MVAVGHVENPGQERPAGQRLRQLHRLQVELSILEGGGTVREAEGQRRGGAALRLGEFVVNLLGRGDRLEGIEVFSPEAELAMVLDAEGVEGGKERLAGGQNTVVGRQVDWRGLGCRRANRRGETGQAGGSQGGSSEHAAPGHSPGKAPSYSRCTFDDRRRALRAFFSSKDVASLHVS